MDNPHHDVDQEFENSLKAAENRMGYLEASQADIMEEARAQADARDFEAVEVEMAKFRGAVPMIREAKVVKEKAKEDYAAAATIEEKLEIISRINNIFPTTPES